MKQSILIKSLLLLFISWVLLSGSIFAQGYENGMQPGVVRVKFKPQLSATLASVKVSRANGIIQTGIQPLDQVNAQLSAVEMKRVFPYSPRLEAKHKKYGLDLWFEIRYTTGVTVAEAVAGYISLNEVDKAEPIFEKQLITGEVKYVASPMSESGQPYNDPHLPKQWHYENTGQVETSIPEGDINLYKAWETEAGKPNVVVCIVDGGVDVDHEDLAANMWVNEAELNGEEGVDDDGNGYVDDINGFNFVDNSGEILPHFHGTHVAGTVGAVNNNAIGVAGVAGGSGNDDGVKMISAQIFKEEGGAGNYAAAIVYGADNGAVISQNSWGYDKPGVKEQAILDAIDYFVAEAGQYEGSPMKGGMVFFAAGNNGGDGEYYPGYYESAVAVAALGPDNKKASYSNYGTWVDIAAPGGETNYGQDHGVLSTLVDNKYGYLQGTSMACPHISGIAALVVSKFGGSTFTNEDLRTHIFTATHDIDQYNSGYEGKLGVGYIDAWLAVQKNNGIAPDAISDLSLKGIAQDFATVTWSVPADGDDVQPVAFEVLYSAEQLTNENADLVDKISGKTDRKDTVGTVMEIEIPELEPTTTYYFAVRSIDRWGNVSSLSNVVSGTTNTGPAINADKEVINLTVNAAEITTAEGNFTILNEDEGVLKWEGLLRHTKHSLSYNAAGLSYPSAKTAPVSSERSIEMIELLDVAPSSKATATPMANYYKEYFYCYPGDYLIGDLDTTLTNSSATRYHVEEAEGFNMTHVEMMLWHKKSTGPMIMEIYVGEELHKKNMILAQEVTSYRDSYYYHYIALDEQLYFEKGTTFWIVFHVPSGNLYPLGVAREKDPSYSDNCLMSLDMGTSWMPLEEAIEDPNYAWTCAAISKNEHLGNYITLSPSSGTVEGFASQGVQLSADASTLINGDYGSNIVLKSNDGDDKYFRIPLNLKVEGQVPVLENEKVVDFGSVFYGHNKEIAITIKNTGYGNFNVKSVVSSDPQFEVVRKPYKIAARDEQTMTILYTPDGAGNDNATIELTDKAGRIHSIRFFGVGALPSEISVSPVMQQLPALTVGDTTSATVTITNTGEYPLEFAIPAFSENIQIEGLDNVHKYGYTLASNVNGDTTAQYTWNDISTVGTDVSEYFVDIRNKYLEVDLGFEFPFYGQKVGKMNLTRYGALALDQEGPMGSCRPSKFNCMPKGFISAFSKMFDMLKGGQIYYYRESGKFIVQYQDVEDELNNRDGQTLTFQIVLFYNGDMEFRYKDVEKYSSYSLKTSTFIAVGDPAQQDGFLVHNRDQQKSIVNESVFRIKAPGQRLVTAVSAAEGMLQPGESQDIKLTVDTDEVHEGDLFQNLGIVSNDPFHNPTFFSVKVNVTGGVAHVSLDQTEVELGQVFQGGERKAIVSVINDGTKDVEITSLALENNKFKLVGEAPVTLKAKSSYFITVEMITTEKGHVTDKLVVETEDGNRYEASIHGEVISAPGLSLDIASISETLEAGDKVVKTITITNSGESDLEMVPAGNDWLYLSQAEAMAVELQDFTYYAMDSDDEDGPSYSWEEIMETGVQIPEDELYQGINFWKAIPLTYEIPFYNQPCDTLWVSWEGVISLSKPKSNPTLIFPKSIPHSEEPNNLIAPYFALQFADHYAPEKEKGVFYQIFEDRIVVEWAGIYDRNFMGAKYSFQAILYKNGNIKYQYNVPSRSRTALGVIGVENADGTDGVQLALYQEYIKDKLAVSLTPAEKVIVPAGTSKQLNIAVDASRLNKGTYNGNFRIFNNTPQNSEVMVPVTLTVNGEPALETSEMIEFGEVMAYKEKGDDGLAPKEYFQEFAVKNTGRDILDVTGINLTNGSELLAEMEIADRWGRNIWIEIPASNPFALVPGDQAKLRIRLIPTGEIAELNDTLVFVSNLSTGDYRIPVHASISLPPALGVDLENVSVLANTPDHQETRIVTIDNTNGQSPLVYHLGINYQRQGEEKDAEETSASMHSLQSPYTLLIEDGFGIRSTSVAPMSEESFETILEHDTLSTPANILGFGESVAFTTSTAFTAPEVGFNLTHVKTWYNPGEVLDSRVQVEIRAGGTSISNSRLLVSEYFDVNLEAPITGGQFFTFELSENQIFYPGETFYVVFNYPLGVALPQAIATTNEDVKGRFMFLSQGDWYDLIDNGFIGHGWMVKALEKEHKTKSWVVIDGETEGSVPVGESIEVNLKFIAADAQDVDNDGELSILTNDPYQPEKVVDMHLHINQGPEFEMDTETSLTVNENETLNVVIPAKDAEGDVCTYALAETYDFVQLSVQNDTLSFVYTPDFESAGVKSFILKGEDVHGNASTLEVPVEVVNVNRAPELISTIEAREYYQDEAMESIDMNAYFVDPDGEELSFDFRINDISIANIYTWNKGIMIEPMQDGSAEITVIASDLEGLSTESTFNLTIGTVTGIEDVEGTSETKVYPVPTSGPLNIVLDNEIEGEVRISILNVTGLTQYQTTLNKMSGEHIERLNISHMPSGIYLVKISSTKGEIVKRVVKI